MSKLTFNQFQQELSKRSIDKPNAYMFSIVYERLIDTQNQLNQLGELCVQFATQLQGFLTLREEDVKNLKELQRKIKGEEDGVSVHSVTNDYQ